MDFYQVLSRYYDDIFPLKEQQRDFLRRLIEREGIKSVLDVGCGTGPVCLELSDWGLDSVGIDLSQEMVEIANGKAEARGSHARFIQADMLDLSGVKGRFDGVLCLGNTLAHLSTEGLVEQALEQFAAKGKNLLIQVVNYDRILAKKIAELPEIRTPDLKFRRYYKHLPNGLIEFSMQVEKGPDKASGVNILAPLTKERLEQAFSSTGWEAAGWWGSFGGEVWSPDSPATIVAAKFGVE